ncbi:pro-hevein-like [Hibiscus syriacus]|uniref:pro-hevein-like n=1 Tax=Hibiscus syriacus TaxID=106335 RepID=UPI001921A55B|nr:pro-hevein-like [Hibiscus syriacus]
MELATTRGIIRDENGDWIGGFMLIISRTTAPPWNYGETDRGLRKNYCSKRDMGDGLRWGSSMAAEDATAYWTDYKVIENDWSLTKVSNTANGKSVTVRVLDTCTRPSLDLDYPAFSEIMDDKGRQDGHLTVNYEFVDCGDDPTIRLHHEL